MPSVKNFRSENNWIKNANSNAWTFLFNLWNTIGRWWILPGVHDERTWHIKENCNKHCLILPFVFQVYCSHFHLFITCCLVALFFSTIIIMRREKLKELHANYLHTFSLPQSLTKLNLKIFNRWFYLVVRIWCFIDSDLGRVHFIAMD